MIFYTIEADQLVTFLNRAAVSINQYVCPSVQRLTQKKRTAQKFLIQQLFILPIPGRVVDKKTA